jgi:3-hydroxyacyl-CoA dehydrogenase/enoyl-CoA hydratase/3-hydroxybutyryl-CoA epimerase
MAAPSSAPLVSVDMRRDGVAVVTIDVPLELHGTQALGAQLSAAIDRLEQDASIAAAVVVGGRGEGLGVCASIGALKHIKFATDAERLAREAAHLLRRIELFHKPLVAAVHDATLGGWFELALACHAVVACDDPKTRLGLPEVRLGLIAAANGMLRIAGRAGLRTALDLSLTGTSVQARRACALGLVDDICPRAILLEVAARHAKALVGHVPRVRTRRRDLTALALERNPIGRSLLFRRAREDAHAGAPPYAHAADRVLAVLERYAWAGFEAGADLEAKAFGELVVGETAHRLIELFFATAALKKDLGVDEAVQPRPVACLGVLGGASIGSGVAYLATNAGVPVRLGEKDDAAAGRALRAVRALVDGRVARGSITPLEGEQIFGRLSVATDRSGLRHADLVVLAVPEEPGLQQALVREVEALIHPTSVIASTTSSLPIARIAQAARTPARVLGMHYFHPAARTKLLEVVRADKTDARAVATAVAFGTRQGKTVIVVKDGPGFYTTRVLLPLLNEAAHLVSEGVAIDAVDDAVIEWGFPAGPFERLDEMGIDVGARVGQALHAAYGERMTPPGAMAKLVADERKGRRNGRGFYRYEGRAAGRRGRRPVDATVYDLFGVQPATRLPLEEIQMRCALALVNEAVRCYGEGVLRSARDGDVGAVFGVGFPSFRGGPFRFVDTLGAAETLRRVQGYADRFGERWRPAPLLVQMAKKGERFLSA